MSCGDQKPLFWQRQPLLPLGVQRFLRHRVEAALDDPRDRALLVWPAVLGAPKLRAEHPDGLPGPLLLAHAARMLLAVGHADPAAAWDEALARFPDTAQPGPDGWLPHGDWGPLGPLVSLRCGVTLSALTGLAAGDGYRLAAAVALFDLALFHETHDALEALWKDAAGDLRQGLQGLILMAAGYHHQQLHNAAGAEAVWEDCLARLEPFQGLLATPWGRVDHRDALQFTEERLAFLGAHPEWDDDAGPGVLWSLPVPRWELQP
jgi:predicted metal-dependent hydrolase